jgi:UDP-N-acetylmuramoyl-L-alanyl-D-glutamate--2,6-diaminopimelate ligase
MSSLKKLLKGVVVKELIGNYELDIQYIATYPQKKPGIALFIARSLNDSEEYNEEYYIQKAIEEGIEAIMCSKIPSTIYKGVTYVIVSDINICFHIIVANFYDNPSKKLKLIGITGTNGKTTIVTLLYNLFKQLGHKVGLISTIEHKVGDRVLPDTSVQWLIAQMVKEGCEYCFMEAHSSMIKDGRASRLHFAGIAFTNLTHDHLDIHLTLDSYLNAKKEFFNNLPATSFALTNYDDINGNFIVKDTKAKIYTFAMKNVADFTAIVYQNSLGGLKLGIENSAVFFKLIGEFNAYNLLTAYAIAKILGKDKKEIILGLSNLSPIRGRLQFVPINCDFYAIVDYAHSPDALENVITTLQKIKNKNSKIILVIGCGGDKDKQKRPKMARIAYELSDKLILTTDNPRSEDPMDIVQDMKEGLNETQQQEIITELNREKAIQRACSFASKGDIVLIAGKGHECYQEIQQCRYPFSDVSVLLNLYGN